MGVGKADVVARSVRITTTEEGIAVSLDIDVNTNAYTAFAKARSKIMIYMCDLISNKKFKCKLIKDWGVWENNQILSFYHEFESNAIRTTLTVVLPNTVVNRLIPLVSGHTLGIKVVTDLDVYLLYNDRTWGKVHARLKKRVLVTEKTVKKETQG
jgi:hypothetical protein